MNSRHRITVTAIVVLSLAAAATLTATASNRAAQKSEQAAKAAAHARVKRGQYLVTAMGCHDCHTPWKMGAQGPEPDMTRAFSGHPEGVQVTTPAKLGNGPWVWAAAGTNTAFSGPWGISYAANLTPERLTGIGIWNEEMFLKTIRTGRHWGVSRPILPPMPWQAFRNLDDNDLKSIYAYLRTVKPIKNQVPDPILAQQQ